MGVQMEIESRMTHWDYLACQLESKLAEAQVLRRRRDASVLRIVTDAGGSVVAKVWRRPGLCGVLRRLSQTSPGQREMRVLLRLHAAGVPVPMPFGCGRLPNLMDAYTDVLFVEDLGGSVVGVSHLRGLVLEGKDEEVHLFEEAVVGITRLIVKASILDADHGLHNIIITPEGRMVRLDFEIARRVLHPLQSPRSYGHMLGRLLSTYIFAVQPEVHRLDGFVEMLTERLQPPSIVRHEAEAFVRRKILEQKQVTGINTSVALRW